MTDLTKEQIDRLAETCGVARNGMDDEQLFEACLRVIARNFGTAL